MSTNAHAHHGTWLVVLNVLIQRFSNEIVLQRAHGLVTQASQESDEGNLEFETHFFNATRKCRYNSTAMEKVIYYTRRQKPFICKEMLEEL